MFKGRSLNMFVNIVLISYIWFDLKMSLFSII